MTPAKGNGQFQWNAGWFGGQIGGTAYLIILGIILAFVDPAPGIIILSCGVIPNIVGCALWKRRDKLAPYPSMQLLMVVIFISTVIAFVTAFHFSRNTEWHFDLDFRIAWILLLYPALMLWFHFIEHEGRKRMKSPT